MHNSAWSWLVGVILVLVMVATGCGGDDDADEGAPAAAPTEAAIEPEPTATAVSEPEPTATEVPEPTPSPQPAVSGGRVPTDVVLTQGGAPIVPIPNPAIPDDWTFEEYTFGGEAVSYLESGAVTPDGLWSVTEDDTAGYRTRMLVRRPPADQFSGVVLVEWMNVTSGTDIAPDWGFLSEEIQRRGHAYVAVSVQSVSVNGTEREFIEGGLLDTRGLLVARPERYGDLVHPGDRYAFDVFTQAGQAVAGEASTDVLGGLEPTHVIATGESQSAAFMTAYINGVHPSVGVYDGFLVHGRGGGAPAPSLDDFDFGGGGIQIRDDLEEPVLIFASETDINVLNYAVARQPDTDTIRTWEVAGTSHSDAFTLAASAGLSRDPALGAFIGCPTLINDGPHHEAMQAAFFHLVAWVVDGTEPPTTPRIEIDDAGAIVRDELGFGVGGARLPTVEAPLRVLSGDPGTTDGACTLFGQTFELSSDELAGLWGSATAFQVALEAAASAAVDAGWLLPEDAEVMVAEELARAESLGLT